MATALGHEIEKRETTIVRVGGLAGFMIFGIYLVVTFALLELPPGGRCRPDRTQDVHL